MNDDSGRYGPALTVSTPRPTGLRWLHVTALAVAVVPTLVYLIGVGTHSGVPGTCDAWIGCSASAREQWQWEASGWPAFGIMLAAFLVAVAYLGPWLHARARARKITAIVAECVLMPLTALFAILFVLVLGTECSPNAFMCFGGPAAAVALGSPGVLTGLLSILLLAGMGATHGKRRMLTTVTLTGIAATLAAVIAGFLATALLSGLAAVLFP